jgi:hypothetical protein
LLDAEIIEYQKKRVAELRESESERKKMLKASLLLFKNPRYLRSESVSYSGVFSSRPKRSWPDLAILNLISNPKQKKLAAKMLSHAAPSLALKHAI